MIIKPAISVISPDRMEQGIDLYLWGSPFEEIDLRKDCSNTIAYIPLINSHDHLISNWVPRAGNNRPYKNSHIWVEDMKESFAFQERDIFWHNNGSFRLEEPNSLILAKLGAYKSLFCGCSVVQDHSSNQVDAYYEAMPIVVPKNFRQCHSLTLGNWWGGETPEKEMELTKGKMPFIVHLGEGKDEITKGEFSQLKKMGLLRANTLIIHGIALTAEEISEVANVGASICWCPSSNFFLIGETLKIDEVLKHKANVCIGTDSTMSGGVNLIAEFLKIREHFPKIPTKEIYRMATVNAATALYLPQYFAFIIPNKCRNLLLVDKVERDPYENLFALEASTIQLLLVEGIPRFGDSEWMEILNLDENMYSTFRTGNKEKFVIGDPMELNDQIDEVLGYHKDFPYLPF